MRGFAALALMLTLLPAPAAAQEGLPNTGGAFPDDNGNVHEAAINAIAAAEITFGCSDDLFCPDDPVARQQMASFLARGYELAATSSQVFDDVAPGSTHAGAIAAIAEAEITRGCTTSSFCPESAVTRAQMASFLARAEGLRPVGGRVFDDVTPGTTHAGAIAAIAQAGITLGCTTTSYCPDEPVTRAQMASFLARALELELIHPTISLSARFRGTCNPDVTRCSGSETFPAGGTYEVLEGWYHVVPFQPGEEEAFTAGNTSFTLTIDGEAVELAEQPVARSGGRANRVFIFRFDKLRRGTYTLVGTWRWQGEVVQRTVLVVTAD